MRKLIFIFLLGACSVLADDTIPFKTSTGQAKVSPSGIGTPTKPYDFSNVSVLGIGGGGGGTPGGTVGQLQYKQGSSAFGGVPNLTFDGTLLSLKGGSVLNITDPTDATKKLQLTLSGITTGNTRNFQIPNADFTGIVPFTAPLNQFVNSVSSSGAAGFAQVREQDLAFTDITTGNVSITKHGFAPKAPNDATKYLDGTGAYTVPPGSGGAPGGSDTQVQRNNAGAFAGISTLTSNGTNVTQKAGSNYNLADPTDATKKIHFTLSGLTTATDRNVTVPNADSILVIPNAGVANQFVTAITSTSTTTVQPSFSNLSGTIATSQQNIPVGKTLYLDTTNGNNATALPNRFDKPYKTLNGVNGLLANASAGDAVSMGPGTFSETGAVSLPQNISFVGSGPGVTTIVTTGGIKPGTGDKLSDFTIDARTGTNSTPSFAIGADTGDTAFTDVTISGVELLGNTNGFFFNKSGIDRVAIYDCSVVTTFEGMTVGNMTTSQVTVYNTSFSVDGFTLGGASVAVGIKSTSGTVNAYGGTILVSNGTLPARAIQATGSNAKILVHNVNSNVQSTTPHDLHQSSSAIVQNDGMMRADGTSLLTSGTITQFVNTYEGNLGLSDITTANVSTTQHGFAPKLPNDSTKFLNGIGTYTVPAGGGGGSPGGANTQIQFNDSSAFGGDADFTWDKTNNVFTVFNGLATSLFERDDATNNDVVDVLTLEHNTSGTPTNGLGTRLMFRGEEDQPSTQNLGYLAFAWNSVVHASRTAYLEIGVTNNAATNRTIRAWGSGGLGLGGYANDPGTGTMQWDGGTNITVRATNPAVAASSVAGATALFRSSDATAGNTNAGAANGGNVTIQGGDAKRLTSGNAAGGDVVLSSGGGVGTGFFGDIRFMQNGNNKWKFDQNSALTPVSVSHDIGTSGLPVATGYFNTINLAGVATSATTGTGSMVLATSPALVTPVLGTPASGVLTNCTGYTEANLSITDITTNNASTSAHGLLKKLDNTATHYMDGTGNWSTPAGGGGASDSDLSAFAALGSSVKAYPVGAKIGNYRDDVALNDNEALYVAVYLPTAQTITGVKFFQNTQGAYTADQTNQVGLYTYSGGTLTLVASSSNNANIWKGGGNTWQTAAFSSTYAASAGVLFIGFCYNSSAQTTAPSLAATSPATDDIWKLDFTNSARLNASKGATNSLPSSIAMSTMGSKREGALVVLY